MRHSGNDGRRVSSSSKIQNNFPQDYDNGSLEKFVSNSLEGTDEASGPSISGNMSERLGAISAQLETLYQQGQQVRYIVPEWPYQF